jgi:hypothetical protein
VEITNEILEQIIAGKAVGDHEAYKNGSDNKIKGHIKSTVHSLKQSRQMQVDLNSDFESGFSTYAEVFCYKNDGRSTRIELDRTTTDGITIYLCALAPIAVMGATNQSRSKNVSSSGHLSAEGLNVWPSGNWIEVVNEIRSVLEQHQFMIFGPREMKKVLPFETSIATIFANPPYQIFDAFFQWED